MEIDWKKVDELTLALMHLTTFDDSCDEGEVRRPQRGGREALARAVREVRRFAALVTRAGAAATAPSSSIPKISARCSFPIAPSVGAAFASAPAEDRLGPAPLGGFFCTGEIGPVGGTTFLHGYTSAFAIFREAPGR